MQSKTKYEYMFICENRQADSRVYMEMQKIKKSLDHLDKKEEKYRGTYFIKYQVFYKGTIKTL